MAARTRQERAGVEEQYLGKEGYGGGRRGVWDLVVFPDRGTWPEIHQRLKSGNDKKKLHLK